MRLPALKYMIFWALSSSCLTHTLESHAEQITMQATWSSKILSTTLWKRDHGGFSHIVYPLGHGAANESSFSVMLSLNLLFESVENPSITSSGSTLQKETMRLTQ